MGRPQRRRHNRRTRSHWGEGEEVKRPQFVPQSIGDAGKEAVVFPYLIFSDFCYSERYSFDVSTTTRPEAVPYTPPRCPASSANAPLKILLPSPWRRARIESAEALSYETKKTSSFLPTNTASVPKISALLHQPHGPNRKPGQPD